MAATYHTPAPMVRRHGHRCTVGHGQSRATAMLIKRGDKHTQKHRVRTVGSARKGACLRRPAELVQNISCAAYRGR